MWYWFLKIVFFITFKICFRLKVEGLDNLPKKHNYILAANHASFLDSPAISAVIPHKIYWLAGWSAFTIPWVRWLCEKTGAFSVRDQSEKAISLLNRNQVVGLFPEGDVSRDGKLKEFRRGAALFAHKTGRPIVPCTVIGTFKALPFGRKFPRFVPIKIKIGKPIYLLKDFNTVIDDMHLQEGMLKVKRAIEKEMDFEQN